MNKKVSDQMEKFSSVAIPMNMPLILCFIIFGIHQQVQACGGVYNVSSGSIVSPLYPDQYPPDQDCIYIINAARGYRITLTFLRFEIVSETEVCQHDYLQIRDGGLDTSPYMGTYCNTTIYQRRSSSNTMWIKFHSDSSQSGAGFEANYTTDRIHQKFFFLTASEPPAIFRNEIDIFSWINISPSGLQDPGGIDYDQKESLIYWTDNGDKTIRSANFDGSDVRLVRNLSSDAVPGGLSADSLSRLIFYTDSGNKVIGMITMDNSSHRIVINSSLNLPKDIELDKYNGVIYWSDCGASPTIERANYDGTGRKTLVSGDEHLNKPYALALDTSNSRLYWADGGTQKVGWVDLEGWKTSVILHKEGSLFYGMDIYLSDLFISDLGVLKSNQSIESHIYRYGTDGSDRDDGLIYRGRLNDIRVYAEETEDKGPNGCGNNNGGCSYICIPTPGNRSKCLTDGTESTKDDGMTTNSTMKASDLVTSSSTSEPAKSPANDDGMTTESTRKASDLVTSSSTSEPTKSPGTESASINTVIIAVVCVMAGVVGITVVVALVVVFKLRRNSDCKQDVVYTRRVTKFDIPLESPPAISNSAVDVVDNIYCKSRPSKGGDNSDGTGERKCEQPKIFTENNLVPHIARKERAFTPIGDYLNVSSVEEPAYDDDFVAIQITGESNCQQPVMFTQRVLLPYGTTREQATAPRDDYANLGYEEEHHYDEFHSGHETE